VKYRSEIKEVSCPHAAASLVQIQKKSFSSSNLFTTTRVAAKKVQEGSCKESSNNHCHENSRIYSHRSASSTATSAADFSNSIQQSFLLPRGQQHQFSIIYCHESSRNLHCDESSQHSSLPSRVTVSRQFIATRAAASIQHHLLSQEQQQTLLPRKQPHSSLLQREQPQSSLPREQKSQANKINHLQQSSYCNKSSRVNTNESSYSLPAEKCNSACIIKNKNRTAVF
jgi:hypothetical protein